MVTVQLNGDPTVAEALSALSKAGAWPTMTDQVVVAAGLTPFVAVMVRLDVPVLVGVPDSSGGAIALVDEAQPRRQSARLGYGGSRVTGGGDGHGTHLVEAEIGDRDGERRGRRRVDRDGDYQRGRAAGGVGGREGDRVRPG